MLLKYLGFCGLKNASSSKKSYPTVIEELCNQFSLEDLRKSTNNFDQKLVIGQGGYATVYKGCFKHNGTTHYAIALKRFNSNSRQGFSEFVKEIELLCQLRHPNLVALVGFCNLEMEKILVFEYMPNRSLQDHLSSRDMEPLSWKKRLEICIGVARGVHYLHTGVKRTIFHRDIKPTNILLDINMVPKLTDFGLCLQGPLSTSKPKPIVVDRVIGTYGFMAPEYARHGTVTDKCDVYSFGMILLQVVCTKDNHHIISSRSFVRDSPIEEIQSPIEEIIHPIRRGKIAPECWEVFMDITKRCLKLEPDERPTIGEVEGLLEHALSLQEEADVRNTDSEYILLSTTIIFDTPTSEDDQEANSNHATPSLSSDDEESDYGLTNDQESNYNTSGHYSS